MFRGNGRGEMRRQGGQPRRRQGGGAAKGKEEGKGAKGEGSLQGEGAEQGSQLNGNSKSRQGRQRRGRPAAAPRELTPATYSHGHTQSARDNTTLCEKLREQP